MLSRKIIKIYSDRTQKYGNVMVKDFEKYEKLKYKQNKLKLDIDFLNIFSKNLSLKFLIFKLPNVSNKNVSSIHKRLLCSAIKKHNKELQHVSKELSQLETFLSKQLSTIDFYILNTSITSHNKNYCKIR